MDIKIIIYNFMNIINVVNMVYFTFFFTVFKKVCNSIFKLPRERDTLRYVKNKVKELVKHYKFFNFFHLIK